MKENKQKKGTVALLTIFITCMLLIALALNILHIMSIIPVGVIWIGFALIAVASVSINVASVAKRNRYDEDNIATISKPLAIVIVTIAFAWLLTFIMALAR